jgi:hypothetical protein
MTKPLNISESAAVQMPMKTVASLIILVAMGVFAYTELTSRLVSLETSRELFTNDLLKKSEQVPCGPGATFFIEDLYKSVEKMEETQEMNMTNKVNIEFLREQLDKALNDIEELKDKVRANGKGRITKKVLDYIAHINKEAKQMSYVKDLKKEVETGKHGTQKYVLKQGPNKGKVV